jgi:cardiolipin synthase
METMFGKDLANSREVTLADWRARGVGDRTKEVAARIWGYWL